MTTLSVTQFDIKVGLRGEACGCPVAIAFNRLLKPEFEIAVYGPRAAISLRGERKPALCEVALPDVVFNFVADFDASKKVQPINVQVDIPEQFLRAA